MAPSHSTIGAPPPTGGTARPERMNPWNWVWLVLGALLTLLGIIMSVIGPAAEVSTYLNDVPHSALDDASWQGRGLLLTGLAAVALGVGLQLLGAGGLGRNIDPRRQDGYHEMATAPSVFPARLIGHLDKPVSRWLWLVKWLLAIPHYIVLSLLSFTLLFTTIASGIAILIIGRYPRPWFLFSVGVLR